MDSAIIRWLRGDSFSHVIIRSRSEPEEGQPGVPRTTFEELAAEKIESDYTRANRSTFVKSVGLKAFDEHG